MPDRVLMTKKVYQYILSHAREALPQEAVGLVGGQIGGPLEVAISLPNLAGPRAFLADPWAQFEAERALQRTGYVSLAVYHSHPGGGAQLSASDCAFAARHSLLQIVVALARAHRPGEEVRAYRMVGGKPLEIELGIESLSTPTSEGARHVTA